MKKSILLLILIATMIVVNHSAYATLKRLNNNPGVVADYATLVAAIAGKSTWDTLYVEPSNIAYMVNSTDVGSSIAFLDVPGKVLIGNGYFLDPTIPNSIQANKMGSYISTTQIGLKVSNGTTCIGLTFGSTFFFNKFGGQVYNIKIISCRLGGVSFYNNFTVQGAPGSVINYTNIILHKNYIEGSISASSNTLIDSSSVFNGISIQNNIIGGNIYLSPFFFVNNNLIIRNNIVGGIYEAHQAYCANNIFLSTDTTQFNFSENNLKNNIFVAVPFVINNTSNMVNNQFNVSVSSLLVPFSASVAADANYLLSGTSPAIGAGVPNGSILVDCGAFGGPDPYKLSGIPPFPTIYSLSTPTVIPAGTNMNVTISTRSNQ
ncbi:MAG: hypothetical protein IPN26_11225 [Bacteroidetes bacterium]|nr:hypothetical protein [Bacteroidota bacterium]